MKVKGNRCRVSDIEKLGQYVYFFFNDTATTEIYTLSLHDALPILANRALAWWHGQLPLAHTLYMITHFTVFSVAYV